MQVELQPAYLLHTRNYRDTSMLVSFLTPNYGLVSGVVKGVRSTGKAAKLKRSSLQLFQKLLISWRGKSDLKSITQFESCHQYGQLTEKRLFSGLYVNELLIRLLQPYDENVTLYALYETTLKGLLGDRLIEVVLRQFELKLLELLGYGIQFDTELITGSSIQPSQYYQFYSDQGFVIWLGEGVSTPINVFSGRDILAIAQGEYTDSARQAAKRLCRLALRSHLGDKPLRSRELFR